MIVSKDTHIFDYFDIYLHLYLEHILATLSISDFMLSICRGYLCHGLCSTEPLLRTSISLASQSNNYPKASHILKNLRKLDQWALIPSVPLRVSSESY